MPLDECNSSAQTTLTVYIDGVIFLQNAGKHTPDDTA